MTSVANATTASSASLGKPTAMAKAAAQIVPRDVDVVIDIDKAPCVDDENKLNSEKRSEDSTRHALIAMSVLSFVLCAVAPVLGMVDVDVDLVVRLGPAFLFLAFYVGWCLVLARIYQWMNQAP